MKQRQMVRDALITSLAVLNDSGRSPMSLSIGGVSIDATFSQSTSWQIETVAELLKLFPRFKNPKFSEEAEVRAHAWNPEASTVKSRDTPAGLAPYVCLDISGRNRGGSPIRRVLVGPTQTDEEVKHVNGLLSAHGLTDVEVCKSEVPLRW